MTDINTINKIKKLLSVAQAGSGATEAEAMTAAQMASMLMLKHNIDVQLDDDVEDQTAVNGKINWGYDEIWHRQCGSAAGFLYSCKPLIYARNGGINFIGRPDNIEACEMTLKFFVAEVERLHEPERAVVELERAGGAAADADQLRRRERRGVEGDAEGDVLDL